MAHALAPVRGGWWTGGLLEAVIPLISLDLDLGKALMERKLAVTDCCLGFFLTLTNFNPHQFLPQKKTFHSPPGHRLPVDQFAEGVLVTGAAQPQRSG